jgi:hypothetical protein
MKGDIFLASVFGKLENSEIVTEPQYNSIKDGSGSGNAKTNDSTDLRSGNQDSVYHSSSKNTFGPN